MNSNFYPDAFEGMAKGIKYGADAVAPTLGIGSNVIIEKKQYPYHILTNDANSIIQALELTDPVEKRGLGFLKEGASATTAQSGDGRTTMVLLLNEILQRGIEVLKEGKVKHLELKKSLQDCLPVIEASLKEQSRPITVEDVGKVARIAGEDDEIADILSEIYKQIGKDGFIEIENLGNFKTNWKLIEGVRFTGSGWISEAMKYDEEARKLGQQEKRAIYHNPLILVTKRKIDLVQEINPLLGYLTSPEYIAEHGKASLVIFADDMNSDVVSTMVAWQQNPARTLDILIVKAPIAWRPYVYEDLAKITGASIVEDANGINYKNLRIEHLGTCKTFICDADEIRVIGGKDIPEHIQNLKEEGGEDSKRRIAWLTQKNAAIMLGAASDSELSYKKLKTEDAIHSSQRALESGIVAGGGVALMNASLDMPDTAGGNILCLALKNPMAQIVRNSGKTMEVGKERPFMGFESLGEEHVGFDAKTLEWGINMFDHGIVDATAVTLGSVRNAVAIVSMLLTAPAYIALPPERVAPQSSPFPFN